jgi:proteasome component ECM29
LCADRAFVTEILDNLEKLQMAFVKLLADPKSKQLSRESCCLGLAACRGISVAAGSTGNIDEETSRSGALNERLLKAFGETTNYGGSAMIETRAQETARRAREQQDSADSSGAASSGAAASLMEDYGMEAASTEVGGTSGLGEAALGAYREMASAAMSLGRPDILYSLMILSVAHPVWFTSGVRDRYSANSLLGKRATMKGGTNAAELREALRPHLASLIPRLLRACNDPNKQTREQMNVLWVALCGGGAESREAITEHLLTTIDTLIDDATNKLWRARVGACGALAEVIVGRSWEDLGGGGAVLDDDDVMSGKKGAVRLLRLWRIATRSLDDVRLTVRESGETLARSVRSLTIRLCDPLSGETKETENAFESNTEKEAIRKKSEGEAAVAASTALRWLVTYGLNQACAEGAGMCVSCLLGIVDVARPSTLQPVLVDLIGSLAMAMSGLEPAALNYLQVRVAGDSASERNGVGGYDRLERMRLQMAQSGPIAGALTKCIDMMPHISLDAQKAVVPQLDTALRCGAGKCQLYSR